MSAVETAADIRPFHVDIPEEELAELRRRIAATRWPCSRRFVPAETVHAVKNVGRGNAAELATYFVEKGKPLVVVVS